jgi:hypothetical protein
MAPFSVKALSPFSCAGTSFAFCFWRQGENDDGKENVPLNGSSSLLTVFKLSIKSYVEVRPDEPPHRRRMIGFTADLSNRQGASGLPRTTPPLALSYIATLCSWAD